MVKTNNSQLSYLRTLTLLYMVMLSGILILAIVVVFLRSTNAIEVGMDVNTQHTLLLVSLFLTIMGIMGNRLMVQRRIPLIQDLELIEQKKESYKSLFIVKLALLEFPAIFNTAFYLITGHVGFVALFGLVIILFLMQRPTPEHVRMRLGLDKEEMQELM